MIYTVLLKVFLAGSHQLDSRKLVAISCKYKLEHGMDADLPTVLESRDDGANESTLSIQSVFLIHSVVISIVAHLDAIGLDSNEAVEKKSAHRQISFPQTQELNLRLLVRHGAVVKSCRFFPMRR